MVVPKGYKETEIGILPADWECITIDELINEISMGPFGSDITVSNFISYGIPVLSGYSVSSDKLKDYFVNFVTEKKAKSLNKAVAHRGDIIVTHRGTLGQISVIPQDSRYSKYVISQSQFRLKVKEEKADPYFIVLFFHSEKGQRYLLEGKGHTGVPALAQPTTTFRKLYVPLPSIPEQHAITSALSDIDTLINSLENVIEKKKAIKQGAMQELLSGKKRLDGFSSEWVEMKLGDVAKLTMGQSPNSQYYNVSKGVPLIQGNADIENRKTIIRFYTEHITKKAYGGDIIFTVRAPVGNVAKATFDCCLGRGVCAIQYENDFLYHYLVFIEGFWNSLSTGSTFDSINSTDLNNSIVKLPPTFAEQTSIATILSDMDNEIETLTHKLEKCRQIKQGMMQELLTGRIRLVDTASKKQRKEKIVSRAKPDVQPQGHNEHFHEAVILSAVVSLFASDKYPLGRFRRQKLAYLLHRHAQESTQGFLKKAAGPYNPTIRYKDEKIALKAGYVAERGNGKFVKGEKPNEAVNYFTQWYGTEAIEWLKQFQFRKNDELEVLTTVAEAIADLKRNSLTITVESIKQVIQSNPEWRPKLDKTYFNDINIQSAMRESQKLFA